MHSFGRAGLICLVECIAAAACRDLKSDNHDTDATSNMIIGESVANFCEIDRGHVLDVWRFILECSKQHFNTKYRRQGTKLVLSYSSIFAR